MYPTRTPTSIFRELGTVFSRYSDQFFLGTVFHGTRNSISGNSKQYFMELGTVFHGTRNSISRNSEQHFKELGTSIFRELGAVFQGTRTSFSSEQYFMELGTVFLGTRNSISRNSEQFFKELGTVFQGTRNSISRNSEQYFRELETVCKGIPRALRRTRAKYSRSHPCLARILAPCGLKAATVPAYLSTSAETNQGQVFSLASWLHAASRPPRCQAIYPRALRRARAKFSRSHPGSMRPHGRHGARLSIHKR